MERRLTAPEIVSTLLVIECGKAHVQNGKGDVYRVEVVVAGSQTNTRREIVSICQSTSHIPKPV